MEKNLKKNIYRKNHFAVYLKLTQHCKSTILQFLKKDTEKVFAKSQFMKYSGDAINLGVKSITNTICVQYYHDRYQL